MEDCNVIHYRRMFSPLKVGNVLLRSRFYASQSKPHSLQGPETFPAEGVFRHYINKARNGAAYVTMSAGMSLDPPTRTRGYNHGTQLGHFPGFDIFDSTVQNYFCQLADALHFHGAKACMMIGRNAEGYDVDDNIPPFVVMGDGGGAGFVNEPGKRMPEKIMRELIEKIAEEAAILQDCGFDMVYMHSAYRLMLPGRFLSLRTNTRDDEFGGSLENRARYLFMICDRIKERCGKGFPVEVSFTALDLEDPDPAKHWTYEDTKEFAKMAQGHIDILQVRPHSVEYVHNMGFEPPLPTAEAARVAKSGGAGVLISSVSGYCHPDLAENALAEGYLDLVGMTRSFISNPNWGDICKEGRANDIVPCIKCNKCHRNSYRESHMGVCSVNPLFGIEHRVDYLKNPVRKRKSIAVVGGGPAGMCAALYASANGHRVTLFEKNGELGGQLNTQRHVPFKWPVSNYISWLTRKNMEDKGVDVRLNFAATKETLALGDYDEIFACVGSTPSMPDIPGIEGENVVAAAEIYGKDERVGEKVVIIGGGDVGVETGFYLTRKGRAVFVIEEREELMLDATPIHYRARYFDEWERDPLFSFACGARCLSVTDKGVVWKDSQGEHFAEGDTVLYAVGNKPKQEEALALFWPGKEIHLLGDCDAPGSIQTCTRDAFRTVWSL
ncbi:MAG: FAD-dependent oxidoreductase [Clostridiales Family XIII bacterium]|jgi:2,4-dienoyl-CoA reductase-like NADH-dependent reductase (Old Yellow Enzyme family)/thioredoxin reductase|nr:FAD-dependent oxidoreductase [Clostridiales Family XIII bacterium]